jgi:hypothetical protein
LAVFQTEGALEVAADDAAPATGAGSTGSEETAGGAGGAIGDGAASCMGRCWEKWRRDDGARVVRFQHRDTEIRRKMRKDRDVRASDPTALVLANAFPVLLSSFSKSLYLCAEIESPKTHFFRTASSRCL